jgi:threonine synthase
MTTVTDPNVHNIAVKGTFDNCQVRFRARSAEINSLGDVVFL